MSMTDLVERIAALAQDAPPAPASPEEPTMARHPNDRPARHLGKRLIASLLAVTLATTPLASHPPT